MDIYLPIANLSVNALVIVLLGGGVGLLSGIFGVGGGFLTTPLLIVYGIPPTVAAASSASQVTGSSVSGVFAHVRRGGVDFKMGGVMVAGGALGSLAGAALFRLLQQTGQIDTAIAIIRRARARRPIFDGDRSHVYDQLVDRGRSRVQAVLCCIAAQAVFAAAGLGLWDLATESDRGALAAAISLAIIAASAAIAFALGFAAPTRDETTREPTEGTHLQ